MAGNAIHIPGSDYREALILGEQGAVDIAPAPELTPDPPLESPIVQEVNTIFSVTGFERPRSPIRIGTADLSEVPVDTKINSVPLKFPGTEYRVPKELTCVRAVLEQCFSYEEKLNPMLDEYYAFFSLQRNYVDAGSRQNSGGLHSDGLQGRRVQPKVAIEHGYSATDSDPTHFFPQAFDMTGVDIDTHLMDDVFEAQIDRRKKISFGVGEIALFDAYCVHQAVTQQESGYRTFFKLTMGVRPYDRAGNTINTLFADDYNRLNWEFGDRSMPTDLLRADGRTVAEHLADN